jgi:hypothetical protein
MNQPSENRSYSAPIAIGGTISIAVAAALEFADNGSNFFVVVRVLLTLLGALAIGIALYLRPSNVWLYVLACFAATLARFGFPAEWDSGPILSGFAAIVAGIGAVLVALPVPYRKVFASVLLLLHFGGILTAMTAPGAQPWISSAFGVLFYRPYLQSMYLTNAYHFYSPEPGPASQAWFCIKYKPDANNEVSVRWYKFPRRPEHMTDPLSLSYYRRLSLTMQLENRALASYVTDEMKRARLLASQGDNGIPIHPEFVPIETQYRLPADSVRDFVLPSYVRHVANLPETQHDDGRTKIDTIRVYLAEHRILRPLNMQMGMEPYDPTTYYPYYMGEFSTDGRLVNSRDILLYWLVPIIRVPDPAKGNIPPWHTPKTHPNEFIVIDGVVRHTGGSDHNRTK